MTEAIQELMGETQSFDMGVGYFYVSGFRDLLHSFKTMMLKKEAGVRVIMGNRTNTATLGVLEAGLSPEEAALRDIEALGDEDAELLLTVSGWMREGRMRVKVYTGDANYFHAKSYLFQEDQSGLRGASIVGSSNFSMGGLIGNTELNVFSRDSYIGLKKWFDQLWDSEEVTDFSPELIRAADEKLPKPKAAQPYVSALRTYLEFAKSYARPPLQIGSGGFWDVLYPHQRVGVAECVNRIRQFGTAVLSDGVGLGKTRTAAGVIRDLDSPKALVIAASKLFSQWESELLETGVELKDINFLTKEKLARLSAAELRQMTEYELIIIDEAHQGFRNSGRKMYRNLQYVLQQAKHPIAGLLLTATPWNNSRTDVFHLGRLFLQEDRVPQSRPYYEYLLYAVRKAAKAFETDDEAFNAFWEDLFLQRTRKTYGGQEVLFAERNFPQVRIVYEPQKETALENNFERISGLRLPYMDPLRYIEGKGDNFSSDRLKLLFLKRADSSWTAFLSTLDKICENLQGLKESLDYIAGNDHELNSRFRDWIARSYGITDNFADLFSQEEEEDLTDFEMISRENRGRYVRKMTERIDAINKRDAKKAVREMKRDAEKDLEVLERIREDLESAFERKDEKYEAVRNAVRQAAEQKGKVILISQFRDTTLDYFKRMTADTELSGYRIAHISGRPDDCRIGMDNEIVSKEEILARFAPIAKNVPEFRGSEEEVDILIGTDTLSVGQNLQDSRVLMNLDLPYNPMVLEQRIGRIDRPRSDGQVREIDIYTFPSMPVIEAELKMTERLKTKLQGIFTDTRFDDLVLPEYEEFLRNVLKERGEAVRQMIDQTVAKTVVPVDAVSHSADYIKAQERMWNLLQEHQILDWPDGTVLDRFSADRTGSGTAVVKTIFRDVNGQIIDTIRQPVTLSDFNSNLIRIEAAWHEAIGSAAISVLDVPAPDAKAEMRSTEQRLAEWTERLVTLFNEKTGGQKALGEQLTEKRAKEVAAAIRASSRGANASYIAGVIRSAGHQPKILKALASAIEYVDARDPEFGDVLDLHEDLERLWKDFGYYADRFIGDGTIEEQAEDASFKPRATGRLASLEHSESVLEFGHLVISK